MAKTLLLGVNLILCICLSVSVKGLEDLKKSGEYDQIIDQHAFHSARAAHFGAAFLPWNRQAIDIFERSLRKLSIQFHNLTIPYWDSVLDGYFPSRENSVLWTRNLFGTRYGRVVEGQTGKKWKVSKGFMLFGKHPSRSVTRNPDFLHSRQKINRHLRKSSLAHLMIAIDMSTRSHAWLTYCIYGSLVNDPIFWILHSFVDALCHEWTNLPGKDNSYPEPGKSNATEFNLGGWRHLKDSPMNPFRNLTNNNGLCHVYPGYEKRPFKIVCLDDTGCGSPPDLPFCLDCQCMSKIQMHGNCSGMPHRASYFDSSNQWSHCDDGICVCK